MTRPNDADALRLRGIVYSTTKDYERALDDLGRAIELRETVEGYVARATIYEAQGKIDKAASDYRRATELRPRTCSRCWRRRSRSRRSSSSRKRVPCAKEGTCL